MLHYCYSRNVCGCVTIEQEGMYMEMKETILKFGGDVKNSASKFAKGAIDSSKKMAEKMKIKRSISQAESRINAAYMEIGKKYEELFADTPAEEFAEQLAEIAQARELIEVAKADLAAIDNSVICEGCGKHVQEDQKFCPFCGMKKPIPAPVEPEAEEAPAEEACKCECEAEACDCESEACECECKSDDCACADAEDAPAEEEKSEDAE